MVTGQLLPKKSYFSSESGFSSRGVAETYRRGQKALFGGCAHNVFPVRLHKNFEKHKLIVNFEVIFDRYQVGIVFPFIIWFYYQPCCQGVKYPDNRQLPP
jgi:hypothetical protein